MSKFKAKKEIKKINRQIKHLESMRTRSQSALVQAILESRPPSDEDVEYFNNYTKQIEELRDKMKELYISLLIK